MVDIIKLEAIMEDLRARGYKVEVKAEAGEHKYRVVRAVPVCDYMEASELEAWYRGLVYGEHNA